MTRRQRFGGATAIVALLGVSMMAGAPACSGSDTQGRGGGTGTGGHGGGTLLCTSGQRICDGATQKTCDGKGGFTQVVDCTESGRTCKEGLGCITCEPGSTATCANGKATLCRDDGALIQFECDATQGMVCEPGGCTGKCSPASLGQSYKGCDYWPTMTLNPVWSGFDFAVAVANAGTDAANVTVTRGATSVKNVTVAAGTLEVIKLPWVTELKGGDVDACQNPPDPGATRVVTGGAYRVRSDAPVTVYQFSPLEYEISPAPADCPVGTKCPGGVVAECKSYSNDASLLLPATALTKDYFALTWPSAPSRAGFLAITALTDGTQVSLTTPGEIVAGAGLDAQGKGTVTLAAGDVLEVVARNDSASGSFGSDLSGARIAATGPVQVIAGHSCANVPGPTTGYCDHLEESIFPVETLGTDYLVTRPAAFGSDSPQVIRVLAITADTHVHYDPPLAGDQTLAQGAFHELSAVTGDVHITADKPILVAQYMQGSTSVPTNMGDPSMSLAIPSEQFRLDYEFIAPSSYDTSFVNVMAQAGTTVTLDGTAIPAAELTPIGASGWSVARHQLSQQGVHEIKAASPFGIVVYGYGKDTSYMYPGGLDLVAITIPPPR
jgi:hypothetical protein